MGLYIPPTELQGKANKVKNNQLSAPDTQLVASGRLASASEADSAQFMTGQRWEQHLVYNTLIAVLGLL